MLKPLSNIHKCLISTPARLVGEYEDDRLLIAPVYASFNDQVLYTSQQGNTPFSRYYYICIFDIKSPSPEAGIVIPDYSYIGELISIALAVYYGKRFDNHGVIESHSLFSMPILNNVPLALKYHYFGVNNSHPRIDLEIELNLEKSRSILEFMTLGSDFELQHTFFTAGKFYLRSLQSVDTDMEGAFLDLITCGEVLSNYYSYVEDEIYDDQLKELFIRLESKGVSKADISSLKSKLYQVRKKFYLTLKRSLNKEFFSKTESLEEYLALNTTNIDQAIKSAYDIRSKYVHTGFRFGGWLEPREHLMNEIQLAPPFIEDKEIKKIVAKIPTYIGFERIIRFTLLSLLHNSGIEIHPDLSQS